MENDLLRYIVHIDMDAFFAAIEQRDNPRLRGMPVVVGADPKEGRGRGVVSTCSYEARIYGIHSAMPISLAYRKCPRAAFLPVDMEKYTLVSSKIRGIFDEFTPDVEAVSIDEAFLDITSTYKLFGTPYQACVLLKSRIRQETGLTASAGLAPTKMAAKIASDLKKPDGLVEVTREKLLDFLWPLEVGRIPGLGKKGEAALNATGIKSIGDLAKQDVRELIRIFGKTGVFFWQLAQGRDERPVESDREAMSISNEVTFEKDTLDKAKIECSLAQLSDKVSSRLRQDGLKARTITLKIRLEGFHTYTRSLTMNPTNFSDVIAREIKQLYNNFELRDNKVRLVGVRASNLSPADRTETLFKDEAVIKNEEVHRAVDKIREKFGDSSIFRATQVKG